MFSISSIWSWAWFSTSTMSRRLSFFFKAICTLSSASRIWLYLAPRTPAVLVATHSENSGSSIGQSYRSSPAAITLLIKSGSLTETPVRLASWALYPPGLVTSALMAALIFSASASKSRMELVKVFWLVEAVFFRERAMLYRVVKSCMGIYRSSYPKGFRSPL